MHVLLIVVMVAVITRKQLLGSDNRLCGLLVSDSNIHRSVVDGGIWRMAVFGGRLLGARVYTPGSSKAPKFVVCGKHDVARVLWS